MIGRWPDFEVVGTASDGACALERTAALKPDLILMDVRMAGMGGVEATARISRLDHKVRIVMLTVSSLGEDMYQALRNGAHGYVSKDEPADKLHDYLEAVMEGQTALSSALAARVLVELSGRREGAGADPNASLTRREREVLRLVVEGLSNEEIAHELHFSEATVKKHLCKIMAKLHMRNRVQVAVYGVRTGIAD